MDDTKKPCTDIADTKRPSFPKRAVVTAGMPYGNKSLHFGHVGGMFIHADMFARFLRDRLGKENVLFVSGTDCYGSPIVESHRQLTTSGEFLGSLEDFVRSNHEKQKSTLDKYLISFDLFAASGFGESGAIHRQMSSDFFLQLYEKGFLIQQSSLQFYDSKLNLLLNGRQVFGYCPVPGCASEKGYADECSLGHPYEPKDLIQPKSALSGEVPELKEVKNWYIDLEKFRPQLMEWVASLSEKPHWRPFAIKAIQEFLEPPAVYVKADHGSLLDDATTELPVHERFVGVQKNQPIKLVFSKLSDRDLACQILNRHQIRFRTGKTLVPFRLTGNVEWGLPAPVLKQGDEGHTFWVWPESLWAPVSFTSTYLQSQGKNSQEWKNWWSSKDSQVYQFIGEDNVYFYSLAEMSMWMGTQQEKTALTPFPQEGELQLPDLVVNSHILYFDKKASSSGALKPPMADDLLQHYTVDQLRAHFLALGLGLKSVGFKPKPFNPQAQEKEADPVMKEAMLLSNTFNKAVRTAFYTTQKYLDRKIPVLSPSPAVFASVQKVVFDYERSMAKCTFHEVMSILDAFVHSINKHWSLNFKTGVDQLPSVLELQQALVDSFYMIRVATVLFHPIAPVGTEKIREYFGVGDFFWNWEHIFEPISFFFENSQGHQLKELMPRVDFFDRVFSEE